MTRSIPVHRAGSYQYSIVNYIDEFKNIDNDVFQLYGKNYMWKLYSSIQKKCMSFY